MAQSAALPVAPDDLQPVRLPLGPRGLPRPGPRPHRHDPIGELLVARGALGRADLARALDLQLREGGRLGDVLRAHGLVAPDALTDALAEQAGVAAMDTLPDPDAAARRLARDLPAHLALRHRAVPFARWGGTTLIATGAPETATALRRALPRRMTPARLVAVPPDLAEARVADAHGPDLARRAECRAPRTQSCRDWQRSRAGAIVTAAGAALLTAAVLAPLATLQVVTLAGLAAMLANLGLRLAALWAMRPRRGPVFRSVRADRPVPGAVPQVTVLVPLHDEPEIVPDLIRRMARLDHPRSALELLLVVEEGDAATRDALAAADLPHWMRAVPVPDGRPRTKPRAMNYALAFGRGEIVAVYDAEDAPAPEQLARVAARFAAAPPDLACLQGRLDFYNASRNWVARCFAMEYAIWFRLVLPGLARLGLVIPLGGTTLFFRRDALEAIGAWDAHNVTEDADLGIRLARAGYRTEVIDVTTLEEANAAVLPWIKQRSRWMKGYAMTWAVHAARPLRLLRDLGARRALGVQLLFLGALLDALFKPAMWSTIVLLWGWPHPVTWGMPAWFAPALAWSMPALTVLNWAVAWAACAAPHLRRHRRWVPMLELYLPLAFPAVVRALSELVLRPFHWEKTAHGLHGREEGAAAPEAAETPAETALARHMAGSFGLDASQADADPPDAAAARDV